ncbi:unnamed protein product [Parascedosporium putredinis]|uniref:Post-SET domain-containing protein n=1 Tax=Parascedosporium putredinis TaxID=1442378 RepID=A0A9P1M8F4_9PEZI|nr:unnamed protein product [Parascedosporium putredinis]CAI7988798.1 unnamed protein product [Parascedosporium putredinis]
MAQPFDCLCGRPSCRGRIAGARDMTAEQLTGIWLNSHIRELLEERDTAAAAAAAATTASNGQTNGHHANGTKTIAPENGVDQTADALRDALKHAEQVVQAAKTALATYLDSRTGSAYPAAAAADGNGAVHENGEQNGKAGMQRRGVTSREMSGEMGGDTLLE